MSTMDDLEDLFDAEDALIANDPPEQNAGDLLPIYLIQSALPRSVIRHLASASSICVIMEAPSEQWVRPLTTAVQTFAKWDYRHFKTTPERSIGYDKSANDHAVVMLARGQRVIAISQAPQNLLPPSMLSAADIVLKIPNPTNAVISSVIKEVTGRTPKGLPANIGTTLSFDELAAGIRSQSMAKECVERLLRAVEAKRSPMVNLETVPHIHELHGYGAAQTWGGRRGGVASRGG
jgi:cell division protease FtsH